MNKDLILSVVRHLLTACGGGLVANGTVSNDELQQVIGALATLIGVGWAIYLRRTSAPAATPAPPSSKGTFLTPLLLTFLTLNSALFTVSCATLRQIASVNLPFVQTEAQLACGAALQLAVSDGDRRDVANMIFSISDAVDTLSDGTAPTPEEFTAKINALGIGSAEKYAGIASAIGGVWTKFYASLSGDPALAVQVMQRISAGCCDAARPYLVP